MDQALYDSTKPRTLQNRILLCDDSRGERVALAHFLTQSGYHITEAATGNSAIDALKMSQIDLILLDLNMPDGDGFKVLNYVYEHRQALPVILITGLDPEQIEHQMHHLRRQELPTMLMKPINPNQLLDILEMKFSGTPPEMQ